jgi:hypothetical protein
MSCKLQYLIIKSIIIIIIDLPLHHHKERKLLYLMF